MNEGNMLMEDIIIMLGIAFNLNLPLLTAWLLDHWLGDPVLVAASCGGFR